jgi:hypothetical protein
MTQYAYAELGAEIIDFSSTPPPDSILVSGDYVSFKVTVRNNHLGLLGADVFLDIRFTTPSGSSGSEAPKVAKVRILRGSTYTWSGLKVGPVGSPGTYGIGVAVIWDDAGNMHEEDYLGVAFYVVSAEITSYTVSSGSFGAGDKISASVIVKNTNPLVLTFYVSFSVQDPSGKWWDASPTSIELSSWVSKTSNLFWVVDPSAPDGPYNARVAVWKTKSDGSLQELLDEREQSAAFSVAERISTIWSETTLSSPTATALSSPTATATETTRADYSSVYIAAIAVLILFIFFALLAFSRRSREDRLRRAAYVEPSSSRKGIPIRSNAEPAATSKYCIQCGAEIEMQNKYCPKCGSSQTG